MWSDARSRTSICGWRSTNIGTSGARIWRVKPRGAVTRSVPRGEVLVSATVPTARSTASTTSWQAL